LVNTEKGGGTPSEAVQHLPDGVTPKIGVGDEQAELRQCETCGRRFRPWRPQATYCSGACRQKAYRDRSRKPEAGAGRWISLWAGRSDARTHKRRLAERIRTKISRRVAQLTASFARGLMLARVPLLRPTCATAWVATARPRRCRSRSILEKSWAALI